MKSILKIFIIIIFSFSIIKSQTDSLPLISNLKSDSISYGIREHCIYKIKHDKQIEYVPYLDTSIFKQPHFYLVRLCLETLDELNSNNIVSITHSFIDSLNSPYFLKDEKDQINIIEERLFATEVLFKRNDYTTSQYLFDYIDNNRIDFKYHEYFIVKSLKHILENVPSFSEKAKSELIYTSQNNTDGRIRTAALYYLHKVLGGELNYLYLDRLINDEDKLNRMFALEWLQKNNYPNLDQLIIQRLYADTSAYVRASLVDTLLKEFGTPGNYNAIKEYLKVEQIAQGNIELSVEWFYPKPPYYLNPGTDYLDYLISLCDTLPLYNWLGDNSFITELKEKVSTAKSNLQLGDTVACKTHLKVFQNLVDAVYKDSLNTDAKFVTSDGWMFLNWNTQYILDEGWKNQYWGLGYLYSSLSVPPANPNLLVNLKNSLGNQIPASNVTYYEGSWKDAVNNGDGTFTVITTKPKVSIRVYYEYASLQADNVTAQNNSYTFTTVNAAVQLKNSLGSFIDIGTVQYYAGAWRTFGTTSNGVAYKELLPINYSFRMTYEYGSIDKQQNLSSDPTVVFQTVNAAVQLKNSLGNLIDQGTVQYYAGAWRTFGTTSNGVAYKELLPINYSFRMTYEYVSKDKQQNLSTNPVVDFNTVLCSVKVSKTSNNQPINNATVKYYAGAWRNLGTTNSSGIATKELLPANISFRAISGNVSLDKQQDISVNSLVEILLNVP